MEICWVSSDHCHVERVRKHHGAITVFFERQDNMVGDVTTKGHHPFFTPQNTVIKALTLRDMGGQPYD